MSKVAIVGAGKTGRGFLARLLREEPAGCGEIIFIDKNADLVDRLNAEGSFDVHFFGDVRPPLTVSDFRAFTWQTPGLSQALAGCDTVLVAVGGQNLKDAGASLSAALGDMPGAIIAAENASHPARTLAEAVRRGARTSEGTVFCTTIEAEGLDIHSENYPYFQFDGDALPGYVPPCERLRPVTGFSDFLTRKLYTYNAASCVIAYLGALKGYANYADAANDPEIVEKLDRNYAATNRVLCREYGYDEADQREFALLSRTKFMNRTIVDTVARNARDPKRKLAAGERIVGPMLLMRRYGEDASVLEETAAAAILYSDPADPAWDALRDQIGPEGILRQVCGLGEDDAAFKAVMEKVREISG